MLLSVCGWLICMSAKNNMQNESMVKSVWTKGDVRRNNNKYSRNKPFVSVDTNITDLSLLRESVGLTLGTQKQILSSRHSTLTAFSSHGSV